MVPVLYLYMHVNRLRGCAVFSSQKLLSIPTQPAVLVARDSQPIDVHVNIQYRYHTGM
jgi:hypothetical protein